MAENTNSQLGSSVPTEALCSLVPSQLWFSSTKLEVFPRFQSSFVSAKPLFDLFL